MQKQNESQMANFMNFATKSPLVLDVHGSKRNVFGILPLLQGQSLAASISCNSARLNYRTQN